MHEFVEECRREWRRLGVPEPIAAEMAVDLEADIAEAEAEGGSAEDVLGDSLFDPRRFAASWAGARGVTNPPAAEPTRQRGPVLAGVAAALLAVVALAAAVVLVGHRSASAAVSVRRVLGPGVSHWFGPGPAPPPWRFFLSGQSVAVGHPIAVALAAAFLVLVGAAALGLAVWYWAPWSRRDGRRGLG